MNTVVTPAEKLALLTTCGHAVRSIEPVDYSVSSAAQEAAPAHAPATDDVHTHDLDESIIHLALQILSMRARRGQAMLSPVEVRQYLTLRAAPHRLREVFAVMFLDAQHQVLETRDMFIGTLTQTSVYPREIVRAALELGAAAVILTHNHPTANLDPSRADVDLTDRLRQALALVDVRVVDHVITGGGQAVSMAEKGLL